MIDKSTEYLLLGTLAAIPVLVYLVNRHRKTTVGSGIALVLLSFLLALVAYVGTFGYAIHGLEDFDNPNVSFVTTLIFNLIMWSICLGAWFFAIRFFIAGIRRNISR